MANEDEQKPGQKQPESKRKFNQQQYDLLKRCSDKKDMTEWNQWRQEHPDEEICLQKADLRDAHLENAELYKANLVNADLYKAHLVNADLTYAHLENANLSEAYLEKASLIEVHLENAELDRANLQGAKLWGANLQKANFTDARLQGTILSRANLKGANFETVIVDGETAVWKAHVDRKTNFSGAGLASVRIDPATKQLLEHNIRRMNWEEWYPKRKRWLRFITRKFWEISDYGISTKRVIVTFFKWAIVFAVIYYILGAFDYYLVGVKDYPGPVADLFVDEGGPISWCLVPLRSIYFSVVTMTTLGFGDMHANPHNPWWSGIGHLLLMLQVLLGYVLLGALVTRFAVLFTAGGPAGKFSPTKTKKAGEDE